MVVAWTITTIGAILVSGAQNMTMAVIGLFLAGAGCESSLRITVAIVG